MTLDPFRLRFPIAIVALSAALAIGFVACGGDDDDFDDAGSDSVIQGNVAQATTVSRDDAERSWLAWIGENVVGFARWAYAQATDTTLGNIRVTAISGSFDDADTTDPTGNFEIDDAPTDLVNVVFRRGNCEATISLPDVTDASTVRLQDVFFDCSGATPGRVTENFTGVVTSKPASQSGNVQVCVNTQNGIRNRIIKVQDATFREGDGDVISFNSLLVGDQIDVDGEREGLGTSSAVDADVVTIQQRDQLGQCGSPPTPTAAAATPTEVVATPTSGPTVTPTIP